MELKIKYNKLGGYFLILFCFLLILLTIILFHKSHSYLALLLFSFISLIGIYIGFAYIFDENAIIIKDNKFRTGYGMNNIKIDLRDVQEIILEKKSFLELVIILKDEQELNIKLTPIQKILNLVMRVKINRNAIKIYSYIIKYDLAQLEQELNQELENIKKLRNLDH